MRNVMKYLGIMSVSLACAGPLLQQADIRLQVSL